MGHVIAVAIVVYLVAVMVCGHHGSEMVRSRLENGGLQNSSSGYTVGDDRLQEKDRAKTEKLDGHRQTRYQGHAHFKSTQLKNVWTPVMGKSHISISL